MTRNLISLWAIDPFADKRTQLKVARHLKEFLRASSTQVEPTAVLNPGQLRIPQGQAELKTSFKSAAEESLKKVSSALKLNNLLPPSLVYCEEYSQKKSVETLLDFAKERKAELIAVGTHSRSGLERWLLGSFAESLILHSNIPLLIVNPKVHTPQKIKTVLFPTDLGEASERGLKRLIPSLKRLNAKVVLYHKMDYVLPETYSMIYRSDVYEKYLKDDETKRKNQLEEWAKKLNAEGIKCDIVVDDKPSFIPKSIVAASKKHKAQLIALVSHTSSTSAMFLGSISRQVVRLANCPIWSWHTTES